MQEFYELNKSYLNRSYLWLSGILILCSSIAVIPNYKSIAIEFIFLIYLSTITIVPICIMSIWYMDWKKLRKRRNKLLSEKPFSDLMKIGFNKKVMYHSHIELVDYTIFGMINNVQIVFDASQDHKKTVEFRISGTSHHLNQVEFKKSVKKLKFQNIQMNDYGFKLCLNLNKIKINSVEQLEEILKEFVNKVSYVDYRPLKIKDWTLIAE